MTEKLLQERSFLAVLPSFLPSGKVYLMTKMVIAVVVALAIVVGAFAVSYFVDVHAFQQTFGVNYPSNEFERQEIRSTVINRLIATRLREKASFREIDGIRDELQSLPTPRDVQSIEHYVEVKRRLDEARKEIKKRRYYYDDAYNLARQAGFKEEVSICERL